MTWSAWLQARLAEGNTYTGIAMGFAATAAGLANSGMVHTAATVAAIGLGIGAIGNFIAKEHKVPQIPHDPAG